MLSLAALTLLLPFVLAAPLDTRATTATNVVPNSYIVALAKPPAGLSRRAAAIQSIAEPYNPSSTFEMGKFAGFAAELTAEQLASLRADSRIAYVQPNFRFHTTEEDGSVMQSNAPNWGLGRLSHRVKGVTDYEYESSAGQGACAYILDTGLNAAHTEFEGRAKYLTRFSGESDEDGVGHGTHVAGIIGSKAYGVAKKAKLFSVKVLDENGSGTTEAIINGLKFAIGDATTRKAECPKGVVLNMSLGGPHDQALNEGAAAVVEAGIFVVVSAGNDAQRAENASPASEPTVFTVGATDINDAMADFSNFGAIVDIFAGGVNITSTWTGSNSATNTISGTSMAAPQVAGLATYILGRDGPMSVTDLDEQLKEMASKGAITGIPADSRTSNFLAFNGYGESD